MNLALQTAAAAKGQTEPNPLVGSVIVNHNRIVGIGAHLKAGEPHAEIHAIRMAGEYARGGTIYVTLEPCSHHGRTGPCAEAIVEAGISRVVVATLDPNPLVSGRGIRILQEAGIEVEVGICEQASKRMNEVFNTFIVQRRPFVTMKAATTLDGKIASASSDSKWITSEDARADVHRLRNENGAILVGVNTVMKDDPELTTRLQGGRNPLRIIVDSTLRIPLDAKVVADGKADTWVFTSANHSKDRRAELEALGVSVFATKGSDTVDLSEMLDILGSRNISSLLVEGGGEVNASFMAGKLVDKLILYIAPKLIGGRGAPTFLEGAGIDKMKDAVEFADVDMSKVGVDYRFTGYPKWQ
ncbi:bifunctional diaminohydroxyphosphoribosylaminopyrimidine deaminase/5-amino-6-(5-phosphoribosylamino)uracil reductase RibD [Paenibacillus oenotherae]|uniref:Riboflavin biosynthesis protein RibD n=2 Tax=Paenibacillus oenotherae TaxID=1435645 RepID=A0ABS7D431_9BACL|nr:bifunctional diaminohydroxyphosphoribosylaminopyrimidine deaminase/5-amino-6-(5-phosphoribosylamino)uracil reductase RibD [Paenibacillus oenotherae]